MVDERRRVVGLTVIALVAAALVVASIVYLRDGETSTSKGDPLRATTQPFVADAPVNRIIAGLCQIRRDLALGERTHAEVLFVDDVHDALHHLDEEIVSEHRALAGQLRQAKGSVEEDILRPTAAFGTHVESLLSVSREALAAGGYPSDRPCDP